MTPGKHVAWLFYNLIFLSRSLVIDRTMSPLTDKNIYYCRWENSRSSQKQPLLVSSTGEIFSSGGTVYLEATDFTNDHWSTEVTVVRLHSQGGSIPTPLLLSSFPKHKHTSFKNTSRPRNRAKKTPILCLAVRKSLFVDERLAIK